MSLIRGNHGGLGGAGAPGGALGSFYSHTLDGSLRFEDGDSPDLAKAFSTAQTDTKIITISVWVKRANISNNRSTIIFAKSSGAGRIAFESNNTLLANAFDTGYNGFTSSAVFRDTSAWYHIVYQGDSTVATAGDRHKVYVNGVQQINANTSSITPQNATTNIIKNGNTTYIGRDTDSSSYYFDGYLAEMNVIDGSIVAPTEFGETVDGVWIPKEYSGNYGNNGFFLPFGQSDSAGFSTRFPDDNSDYITHSDSTAYDIGSSDDFTIEFFFNTDDVGGSGTGGYGNFMGHYATAGPHFLIGYDFRSTTRLIYWYTGNGAAFEWDVSGDVTLVANKWHHMVFQRDGTTLRAYIDGTRLTSISDSAGNTGYTVSSGKSTDFNKAYDLSQIQLAYLTTVGGDGYDGFLSNVRFVIGNTVYADDDNNITVPTATLTAITGTKLLTCHNATVGDDASSENNDGSVSGAAAASTVGPFSTSNFFQDASGNAHHFAPTNLFFTDAVPDSPTNNFAVLNPLDVTIGTPTISEGNLKISGSGGGYDGTYATIAVTSGQWYAEFLYVSGDNRGFFGVAREDRLSYVNGGAYIGSIDDTYGIDFRARAYTGTSATSSSGSQLFDQTNFNTGDIGLLCFDIDNGKLWFGRRDVSGSTTIWYDSSGNNNGDPSAGSNPTYTFTATGSTWFIGCHDYAGTELIANFGQDGSFAGNIISQGASDANGIGDFNYIEDGFLALCTSNLPDTTIGPGQSSQADSFFETMLYTGNGAEQHIGSGGIQHPQDTISITNSLRFEAGSSAYLSRTQGSSPTNIGKWTVNFWLKRTNVLAATDDYDTVFGVDGPGNTAFTFLGGKIYLFVNYNTSGSQARLITNREFLNTATFYNFHITFDRTASTASERLRLYVNGVEETSFSTDERSSIASDSSSGWNVGSLSAAINRRAGGQDSRYHNGYIAQFYNIDGAVVAPTEFAQVGSSGHWIPKTYTGSYGNNGWLLEFKQTGTGSGATNTVGADTSGNNNHWDSSGIAAEDVTIDSPTQNFSVLNPNRYSGIGTFSEGNLKVTTTTNNRATYGTIAVPSSGKWYYEVRVDSYASGGGAYFGWGTDTRLGDNEYGSTKGIQFSSYNEQVLLDGSGQSGGYGSNGTDVASNGDVYSILLDVDNGLFYYAKNGTYFNSANPSNGTGGLNVADIIMDAVTEIRPILTRGGSYSEQYMYNFGQDPSFNGGETAPGTDKTDANGVGKFLYDVPTGFLALMDDNIPQEGIESPDWVWIKSRAATRHHMLYDSVRGATKAIRSSLSNAEVTGSTTLISFDGQGFTVGSDSDVNTSAENYVAWNWKAGGEPTADNSAANNAEPTAGSAKIDGSNQSGAFSGSPSIAIKRLSASTTAGFSIVKWTGTGSAGTIPHGLGAAPDFYTVKNLTDDSTNWQSYHRAIASDAETDYIYLNSTAGADDSDDWNDTAPTANVFSVKTHNQVNASGDDYLAYVFAPIEGYSKFGNYIGNNSTDGPFVFTGFRPAWVMLKRKDSAASWLIYDNKRDTYNQMQYPLFPNLSNAEYTSNLLHVDFLSNGFKIRNATYGETNIGTYIYLAFAEAPFKFANAR